MSNQTDHPSLILVHEETGLKHGISFNLNRYRICEMGRSSRGSGRGLEAGGLHSPQMHPQADHNEVLKFPYSETKAKEIKPAKTSQIICKAYYNTEFNVSPYVHEIRLPRWSCIICIASQFLSYFSKVSPATGNFWIKALKFSVKRQIDILSHCKWTVFFFFFKQIGC